MRILNINKPSGWTSFDAVRHLKGRFREKKAGHLGTLDPMAIGVLPIFFGKATRLIPYFNDADKGYRAEITLGVRTDTLDAEGRILAEKDCHHLDADTVRKAAESFRGTRVQRVPVYSAVKVDGKPSYELARQGLPTPIKTREVLIHELEVERVELPKLQLRVLCSKGTYIRAIADDLGQMLKVGAHLNSLNRLNCGPWFLLQHSVRIDFLDACYDRDVPWVDPVELLSEWETIVIDPEQGRKLGQGQRLKLPQTGFLCKENNQDRVKALDQQNNLVAVGRLLWDDMGYEFQPSRVFV